ncbi:hypothetical protein [Bradyrhizobium ottawaense]|nr:hypothetical protein [Bradyrhizobium ottawaense]
MRARIKQRLTELAGLDPKIGGNDQFLFGMFIGIMMSVLAYLAIFSAGPA